MVLFNYSNKQNQKSLFSIFTTKPNQSHLQKNSKQLPNINKPILKNMIRKSTIKESLTNEKQLYCIRLSFLEQKNFKFMYENALKLNKNYQTFVETIQNYFRALHQFCSSIRQPAQDKIKFLYYFRRFIYEHSKITFRITDYQIGCLLTIKQTNTDEGLSQALFEVVESAKKYLPFQKQIRQKKEVLTTEFTLVKSQYMNLLKKMKKPKYFYDRKSMRNQFQQLKSKVSTNQKAQQSILSQIMTVDTNTTSYFHQIDTFRKQLLKNKYRYHKKFTQLAMNSRQSLAQLFYYQYNCLNDYYKLIMVAMEQHINDFGGGKVVSSTYRELVTDASGCMAGIVRNTQEFLDLLLGIENDLKKIEKNFALISKKLNENKQKSLNKIFYQQINKFFQLDQSPVQAILETINVFQHCFRKMSEKQVDVRRAAQQIQNIRKEIIKHRGITLSLLKVKLKSSTLQNRRDIQRQEARDQCGVYDFMNSLDLKPVKYLIKQILDRLLFTLSEILQFFGQHSGSKQKLAINNSMQLSYIQKPESEIRKKRPVKDELWLWEDYRKRVDIEFTLSKQLFSQINTQYLYYKDSGEMDLQLQKYECYNEQIQQQGDLCVSKKAIKFIAKNGEKQLTIPLADIEEIKRKKIVIKQWLIIKTKVGELMFRQFSNLSQVQITLKQIVQTGGAPKAQIQKRPKIQLTQAQKAKLQSPSRKQQMQKIRPAITAQFQQIQSKTFQNFPIDQFYDLILSDKKFTLTGKENDSFLVYAMKKLKNKDFKITKFDPPGPKYYTLDQNTTFQNGPLVSECKYEYKHLLDMPFLPSECGNHQTRKIYWVSNKQLDYTIHAQTSGVPLSDNFYVELLYKLKQENESTTIKVYAQIVFLKSFALKNTVESSTWKEVKDGTRDTLAQMEKGINLYKTLLSGQAVQIQQQVQTGEIDSKKQMEKLKQRNLYLIIAVVVILLINIMVKIFF